jgi:hypothetical protein
VEGVGQCWPNRPKLRDVSYGRTLGGEGLGGWCFSFQYFISKVDEVGPFRVRGAGTGGAAAPAPPALALWGPGGNVLLSKSP